MNVVFFVIVAYVVYNYFVKRESMTNTQTILTAVAVVVGIAIIGGLAIYATSR